MSRVEYNEDYTWGQIRWAGAAKRAIYGRPGQAFLRELREALLALPEPKLIADDFITSAGEVCALGAVAKARDVDMSGIDSDEDVANRLGITYTLAWEIMSQNDGLGLGPYGITVSPEQRYLHVLQWVESHIEATE